MKRIAKLLVFVMLVGILAGGYTTTNASAKGSRQNTDVASPDTQAPMPDWHIAVDASGQDIDITGPAMDLANVSGPAIDVSCAAINAPGNKKVAVASGAGIIIRDCNLTIGDQETIKVKNAKYFSVKDKTIISVTKSGTKLTVAGLAEGSTTITLKNSDKKIIAVINVTVEAADENTLEEIDYDATTDTVTQAAIGFN